MHGHRTADEKKGLEPRMRLKTFMGEHAMVADGNAIAAKGEEGEEEGHIHPSDVAIPKQDDGGDESENGKPNKGKEDDFGDGGSGLSVRDR